MPNTGAYQIVFLIDEALPIDLLDRPAVVRLITHTALRILTYFTSRQSGGAAQSSSSSQFTGIESSDCGGNRVEWGFTLFNSAQSAEKRFLRGKSFEGPIAGGFREFSVRQFESFQAELESVLLSRVSEKSEIPVRVANTKKLNDLLASVKCSLQRLMYDFSWDRPDMTSPVKTRTKPALNPGQKALRFCSKRDVCVGGSENYAFILASCPGLNPRDAPMLGGGGGGMGESALLGQLLPPHVLKEFTEGLRLKVFWIDSRPAPLVEDDPSSVLSSLNEALARLGGGCVIPVDVIVSMATTAPLHCFLQLVGSEGLAGVSAGTGGVEEVVRGAGVQEVVGGAGVQEVSRMVLPCSSALDHYTRRGAVAASSSRDTEFTFVLGHGTPIMRSCRVQVKPVSTSTGKMLTKTPERLIPPGKTGNIFDVKSPLRRTPSSSQSRKQRPSDSSCDVTLRACAGASGAASDYSSSRRLVARAVLPTTSVPLTLLHADTARIVSVSDGGKGKQQGGDVMEVNGESDCVDFIPMLMHLALAGTCLLVEMTDGYSTNEQSRFCVLRPLTATSATLTFCRSDLEARLKVMASELGGGEGGGLGEFLAAHRGLIAGGLLADVCIQSQAVDARTASVADLVGIRPFVPSMLESWFLPECSATSSDLLINGVDEGCESIDRSERKLLRRLCKLTAPPHPPLLGQTLAGAFSLQSSIQNPYSLPPSSRSRVQDGGTAPKTAGGAVRASERIRSPSKNSSSRSKLQLVDGPQNKVRSSTRQTPRKESTRVTERSLSQRSGVRSGVRTPRKGAQRGTPRKGGTPGKAGGMRGRTPGRAGGVRGRTGRTPRKQGRVTPSKRARETGKPAVLKHMPVVDPTRFPATRLAASSRVAKIFQLSKEVYARRISFDEGDLERGGGEVEGRMGQGAGGVAMRPLGVGSVSKEFAGTAWQEWSSVEELVAHLVTAYERVSGGEGTPLIGIKLMVHTAQRFLSARTDPTDCLDETCRLIRSHLVVSSAQVRDKFKGREDAASQACKLREYEMQVLLLFELDRECVDDSAPAVESTVTEVVSMLRAMSFVREPGFLSSFLQDVLLSHYLASSPRLLYHVYDELAQPIPPALAPFLSPGDLDEDASVPLPSAAPPPSLGSSLCGPSHASESHVLNLSDRPRPVYRRSATFEKQPSARQIQVNLKSTKTTESSSSRRSLRVASASKQKPAQCGPPVAVATTKVKRMLFDGGEDRAPAGPQAPPADPRRLSIPLQRGAPLPPRVPSAVLATTSSRCRYSQAGGTKTPPSVKRHHVLKTRTVAETPVRRQGCTTAQRMAQRSRRRSSPELLALGDVQVVLESPVRPMSHTAPRVLTQTLVQPQLVRQRSFYSGAMDGQSRNVTRYEKLEQRITGGGPVISPSRRGATGASATGANATEANSAEASSRVTDSSDARSSRSRVSSAGVDHSTSAFMDRVGSPPRRINPRLLSDLILSPSPLKQPHGAGPSVWGLSSPCRSVLISSGLDGFDSLASPSRGTRLQVRLAGGGEGVTTVGFGENLRGSGGGGAKKRLIMSPARSAVTQSDASQRLVATGGAGCQQSLSKFPKETTSIRSRIVTPVKSGASETNTNLLLIHEASPFSGPLFARRSLQPGLSEPRGPEGQPGNSASRVMTEVSAPRERRRRVSGVCTLSSPQHDRRAVHFSQPSIVIHKLKEQEGVGEDAISRQLLSADYLPRAKVGVKMMADELQSSSNRATSTYSTEISPPLGRKEAPSGRTATTPARDWEKRANDAEVVTPPAIGGIKVGLAMTTPLGDKRRAEKTPDSLDKWHRRKPRFGLSPCAANQNSSRLTNDNANNSKGSGRAGTSRMPFSQQAEVKVGPRGELRLVKNQKQEGGQSRKRKRQSTNEAGDPDERPRFDQSSLSKDALLHQDYLITDDLFVGGASSSDAGSLEECEEDEPLPDGKLSHISTIRSSPASLHSIVGTRKSSGFSSSGDLSVPSPVFPSTAGTGISPDEGASVSPVFSSTGKYVVGGIRMTPRLRSRCLNDDSPEFKSPVANLSLTPWGSVPLAAAGGGEGASGGRGSKKGGFSPALSQHSIMHLMQSPLLAPAAAERDSQRNNDRKRSLCRQFEEAR